MEALNFIIVGFCGFVGFYVALALLLEIMGGEYKTADFWRSIGRKAATLCGLTLIAWLSLKYLPHPENVGFHDECVPSRANPC